MAFKFNGGRGAIVCDSCSRIVREDVPPPADGEWEIEEFCGPICEEKASSERLLADRFGRRA